MGSDPKINTSCLLRSLLIGVLAAGVVNSIPRLAQSQTPLQKGKALYQQKNYSEAMQSLAQVLYQEPQHAEARFYYGLCHYQLRDYDQAAQNLKMALFFNPGLSEARKYLGISLFQLGQLPEAKTELEKAKKAFPQDQEIASCLSKIKLKEQPTPKAGPPPPPPRRPAPSTQAPPVSVQAQAGYLHLPNVVIGSYGSNFALEKPGSGGTGEIRAEFNRHHSRPFFFGLAMNYSQLAIQLDPPLKVQTFAPAVQVGSEENVLKGLAWRLGYRYENIQVGDGEELLQAHSLIPSLTLKESSHTSTHLDYAGTNFRFNYPEESFEELEPELLGIAQFTFEENARGEKPRGWYHRLDLTQSLFTADAKFSFSFGVRGESQDSERQEFDFSGGGPIASFSIQPVRFCKAQAGGGYSSRDFPYEYPQDWTRHDDYDWVSGQLLILPIKQLGIALGVSSANNRSNDFFYEYSTLHYFGGVYFVNEATASHTKRLRNREP